MKAASYSRFILAGISLASGILLLAGCASTGDRSSAASTAYPRKFGATDGRTIDIGKSSLDQGGRRYENPHMEKGQCWVAEGFNFNGYDTLYIAPTTSTAKFPDKPEDQMVHGLAKESLVTELARMIKAHGIFSEVVTRESEVKPGAKVLVMDNSITEFSKGGGAARYFVGLYGGGQPVLRVVGTLRDGTKPMFKYEAVRSGVSAGARMTGVFMKDEDIQIQDIRSMVLDITDFMAAVAGKYQAKS